MICLDLGHLIIDLDVSFISRLLISGRSPIKRSVQTLFNTDLAEESVHSGRSFLTGCRCCAPHRPGSPATIQTRSRPHRPQGRLHCATSRQKSGFRFDSTAVAPVETTGTRSSSLDDARSRPADLTFASTLTTFSPAQSRRSDQADRCPLPPTIPSWMTFHYPFLKFAAALSLIQCIEISIVLE